MDKIVIYGHKHWPSCEPAKEFLLKKNVKFAYQDMSESILALKTFLKIRESRPEFDQVKERGLVGIPCTVVNDGEKIIIDYDEEALDKL